jgi:hypothetical protein
MTSIVVAAALAAWSPEPDSGVVPAGFFPGGGGAYSGTTTYYGFGREVPYGFGVGSEAINPYRGTFGPDGRRYDYRGSYSPSPYDQAPARRSVGGTVVVGGYSGGGFGGPVFGGGLFRRR